MRMTINRILALAAVLWTAVCAGSLEYHIVDLKRHVEHLAHETARESIEKDMLYRYWASEQGGIYVPVSTSNPPDRHLASIKDRDAVTSSGRRLTLMHPASMMRQVHDLGRNFTDIQGHITSLKPLQPENAPDAWEVKALKTLEAGAKEFGEVVDYQGSPHYRLMFPLVIVQPCLACHAAQGYRLGDLRGGIGASIPMGVFDSATRDHFGIEVKLYGVIWVLGLVGISLAFVFARRRGDEQEQAEEALRRNWEFTQSIIENEPECVKILGPGGELKFMNRAGLAMIDAESLDAVLDQKVQQLVVPEHREAFVRLNERVFAGESGSLEFAVISLTGRWRWLETHAVPLRDRQGKVESLLGITRDITERKRSEETIRDQDFWLRKSQQVARLGSYVLDIPSGTWTSSEILDDIFGIDEHYARSVQGWIDLVHTDDRERMAQHFAGVLAEKNRFMADYRIIRHSDRKVCWVSGLGKLVLDESGVPMKMLGTIQDITKRKREEEQKEHLEQQLLQAQKIESVGRLAGGIAHDINNMLTPILGYAELLSDKIPTGDERREDLAEIKSAATRVKDLTQQLLAFARKQTLDVRPLDVNVVISRFGKMLQRTLRDDILIKLNLAPSVGTVLADEGQLEQVLMNLAVNAQDAMPGGGVVNISTEDLVLDESFAKHRPGLSPGRYVVIRVADTGMGMDSGTLARMFEPFFTTKDPGRGTGLGLAMVYGIIKQHKGYVDVQSEPRQGASFSLYLPVADEAVGQEQEATGEREALQGGSETILVIEDEEQVLRLVTLMLGEWGYRVLAALSGREALDKAGTFSGEIHLAISDVIMPDMNGKEVLEKLREVRQNIKVLYMSGYSADVISSKGVLDSGVNFLRKPFSVHEFAAKVRQVLDGSGR